MAEFERSGKRIIRVKFTAAEKKAMDEEISRQLREEAERLDKEELAVVAWELHEQLGWGEKRIRRFLTSFYPSLKKLIQYYQVDLTDASWLCSSKLKENRIPFDDIWEEIK